MPHVLLHSRAVSAGVEQGELRAEPQRGLNRPSGGIEEVLVCNTGCGHMNGIESFLFGQASPIGAWETAWVLVAVGVRLRQCGVSLG
jgi:hypothetical protein